jgi:hypothetical protein
MKIYQVILSCFIKVNICLKQNVVEEGQSKICVVGLKIYAIFKNTQPTNYIILRDLKWFKFLIESSKTFNLEII